MTFPWLFPSCTFIKNVSASVGLTILSQSFFLGLKKKHLIVSNDFIVIILGQYTFLCLQAFCLCVFVFILCIVCFLAFIPKTWGCFWKPFLVHSLDMKQSKLSQWDMTRYTVFFHCMCPLLGKSYVTAPHLRPASKHKQYNCFQTVT